jgi:hypothetical protein
LEEAQNQLSKRSVGMQFIREFPYQFLFAQVRYGGPDFYGKPSIATSVAPTREWKANKKKNEYVITVSVDGSAWEKHDKERRTRIFLPAPEISRQVGATVVAGLVWAADCLGLRDDELRQTLQDLGPLPDLVLPERNAAHASEARDGDVALSADSVYVAGNPMYRSSGTRLEFIALDTQRGKLITRRGDVGHPAVEDARDLPPGTDERGALRDALEEALRAGYVQPSEDSWVDLEVVVPIDGFGTRMDNERKNRMAEVLRAELPRRGLGRWTGDSIGGDTFEIGVRVIHDEIARRTINDILGKEGLGEGARIEEL